MRLLRECNKCCAETWISELPTASSFFVYVIEKAKVKGFQYKGYRVSAFIFIEDMGLAC